MIEEIKMEVVWTENDKRRSEDERKADLCELINVAKKLCGGDQAVPFTQPALAGSKPGLWVHVCTAERFELQTLHRLKSLEQQGKGESTEAGLYRQMLTEIQRLRETNMVTIKQLAREAGKSIHTVRERIYRARDEGGLKVQTVRGAILVDRAEGLRIAMERKTRGRPQRAVFSE